MTGTMTVRGHLTLGQDVGAGGVICKTELAYLVENTTGQRITHSRCEECYGRGHRWMRHQSHDRRFGALGSCSYVQLCGRCTRSLCRSLARQIDYKWSDLEWFFLIFSHGANAFGLEDR